MAYLTYGELKREMILLSGGQVTDLAAGEFLKLQLNRLVESYSWSTLRGHAVLATRAEKTAGTLTGTSSTTAIGTGTDWTSADIGSDIRVGGEAGYYRVTGVNVDSQIITIAQPFAGVIPVVGAQYRLFRRIYILATNFRKMHSIPFDRKLIEVTVPDLDRIDPERTWFGDPLRFAYLGVNSAGVTQVELHPIPSSVIGLPYSYLTRVVLDVTTPLTFVVPIRSDVLVNLAAADAMDAKAIELAERAPQMAQMLMRMADIRRTNGTIALEEAREMDLTLAGTAQAVRDVDADVYRGGDFAWDHDLGI